VLFAANEKPGDVCAQFMRELSLAGTQQGYPKERINKKIKSFHRLSNRDYGY